MASQNAGIDANSRATLTALASDGSGDIVDVYADKTTHRLLADLVGGFTNPMTTKGDIIYSSDNSGTPARLGIGSTGQVLQVSGGIPSWQTHASSQITVGTTLVGSGTNTRVLYDNNGTLGEYDITGTGKVVLDTAPTFQTSITGAYLTISELLATDASKNIVSLSTVTYPSLTEISYVKGVTSAIQTQLDGKQASGTYVTSISIASANGVSGSSSGGATPALTISLGAITPTSVNGLTITTTTGTLTIASGKTLTNNNNITLAGTDGKTLTLTAGLTVTTNDGTIAFGAASKTLTVNKSLTLDGTDSTTMTFPSTSATIARTDAAQTFTGTQTFSQVITTANTVTVTTNAGTVPVTSKVNNFTNSSASAMTVTLATSGAVDGQDCIVRIFDASAVAKGITWVNTENSANVTAPANSAGSTTIPLTVGFKYNSGTSKWTCVAYS